MASNIFVSFSVKHICIDDEVGIKTFPNEDDFKTEIKRKTENGLRSIDVEYIFDFNQFYYSNQRESTLEESVIHFLTYVIREYMPFGILSERVFIESKMILDISIDVGRKFFEKIPKMFIHINKDAKMSVLQNLEKITKALHRGIRHENHVLDDFCTTFLEITIFELNDDNKYEILKNLVLNTQHRNATVGYDVGNIFEIRKKSYNPMKLKDHRVLLHATYPQNVVGILKDGLLIAPEHVMRASCDQNGRGIYFSDTVAATLNRFIDEEYTGNVILFVCTVAIGHQYDKKLYFEPYEWENGVNSIFFKGELFSNIPKIKLSDNESEAISYIGDLTALDKKWLKFKQYNEYIIRNENQVRMDYIIKLNKRNKLTIFNDSRK